MPLGLLHAGEIGTNGEQRHLIAIADGFGGVGFHECIQSAADCGRQLPPRDWGRKPPAYSVTVTNSAGEKPPKEAVFRIIPHS